jgi:hypothetical protein
VDNNSDTAAFVKGSIVVALVVVVVVGIIAIGTGLINISLTNLQWKAWQRSDVNIQSLQTELSTKMAGYADLETKLALYKGNESVTSSMCGQEKNLLRMFYEAYDKLQSADASAISADVKAFVTAHPRDRINNICQ